MTKALSDMTDDELHRHYTTASSEELRAAAVAEQAKMDAAKRPARKTAPRRVVINRAGAGQSVPIQAGRSEGNTTVRGGTVKKAAASKSASAKKAAPRSGGHSTATFINNGATVGLQAGSVDGATVVVNTNGSSSSTQVHRPSSPAPAEQAAPAKKTTPAPAKKAAPAAKKVVKKAPAKKTPAKDIPSTPPKPSVADAVAQVKADQEKRLAAEEKARKAAARAATRPGQPEQGPQVTGLPLPKTAAKKVVKKAPARPPVTFAARHRKVRRAIRLIRRKPHHALGLTLVFLGTGAFHIATRAGRYGGRKSLAGLKAMGRGYDQYRRMARAAKLEHKHAGCSRCGGTGTIPLRAPDGSYAGSQACRG